MRIRYAVLLALFWLQASAEEPLVGLTLIRGQLEMYNTSGRDVTFFSSIVTDESMRDVPVRIEFLPTYGHSRYLIDFVPHDPPMTLNAGERYVFRLPQGSYSHARLKTLIFGDRSWWGNPEEAKMVFQSRAAKSEQYAVLLDAVKDARAARNVAERYAELIQIHKSGFVALRLADYQAAENGYGGHLTEMMLRMDTAYKGIFAEHSVPGLEIRK